MKVFWSKTAINDLEQIRDYISQGSSHYAYIFIRRIFEMTKKVSSFPQSGRKVPEMNREDIREFIFRNYRIIYLIRNDSINILTVIHGVRNFQGDSLTLD